jgi:hypothetical protein
MANCGEVTAKSQNSQRLARNVHAATAPAASLPVHLRVTA